jgi:hypothetical protein
MLEDLLKTSLHISEILDHDILKLDFLVNKNNELKLIRHNNTPDIFEGKVTNSIFKDYNINFYDILLSQKKYQEKLL